MRLRIVAAAAAALAALGLAGSALAGTVVVAPGSMQGWQFYNDNHPLSAPTGSLVAGPATPPAGTGSAHLGTADSSDGQILGTAAYLGVPLASITALDYWTAQDGPTRAIALQFDIRYRPGDVAYGGRLVYEPYQNVGTVAAGWQHWTGITAGKWWASKTTAAGSAGLCPQASPCTWQQVLAVYPDAAIMGGLLFKAGSGWGVFDGSVDALTVGIAGAETTWDFDDALPSGPGVPLAAFTSAPGPVSTSQSAAFAWSGPAFSRYTCSLDGAAAAACSSPRTYHGLAAGAHTLCIKASGDVAQVCRSWAILSPGKPVASITGVSVAARQAVVAFTADQAGSRFTCSIDGGAYRTCSAPLAYNGLARGSHTVRVLATNFAGDTSAVPASATFSIS